MAKQRKVAVVDDDVGMLGGLQNLLDAQGFAVEVFSSAEAFLDFYSTKPDVDCLLLDIHLGGMSGIELRRHLKTSGTTLPVIFMTARDDDAMRRQALEEGCIAYLRKPVASRLLFEAIEKATA
jgi:FixJ family two-component response regulator